MTSISLSELARRIGRDKALVSRWSKSGRIPRLPDGSFDEVAVRRALKGSLDPARAKPLTDADNRVLTVNTDNSVNIYADRVRLTRDGDDLVPTLDTYRHRTDISADPFIRGVFFGLHRIAFDAAVYAADCAVEAGAPGKVAYALTGRMREAVCGIIWDICRDLNLTDGLTIRHGGRIPPHLVPDFCDHRPEFIAMVAGERLDLSTWDAWRSQIEEAAHAR